MQDLYQPGQVDTNDSQWSIRMAFLSSNAALDHGVIATHQLCQSSRGPFIDALY
jgi:hypothetical protein